MDMEKIKLVKIWNMKETLNIKRKHELSIPFFLFVIGAPNCKWILPIDLFQVKIT